MEPILGREFFDRLNGRLDELARSYREASPFPSIVIDDFLPPEVLEKILEEFPSPDAELWHRFNNNKEIKLGSTKDILLPSAARHLLQELNSGSFLEFLEALTGIPRLISDMKYMGGGLHQILPGGKLAIHADFNKHPENLLDRRLNLLIYLNKDWKEEYGGHFEMWDTEMKACQKRILPIFNRCVVFSTTSTSYHGHPDPLTCPSDRTRRSLALYYYSNGRPESEIANSNHSTLFQERPGENLGLEEERRRIEEARRESERLAQEKAEAMRQQALVAERNERRLTAKRLVKELTPPIIWKGMALIRNKLREPEVTNQ